MKKSKILVMAVTLVLLLSSCGEKKPQVPEAYQELFTEGSFDEYMVWTTNDEKYRDLISQLSEKCESALEGSLIVATDDQVIYAGGWNSIETDGKTGVNPFTTYEIGSMTKQFTAACILQQVQAGNIRTDETIEKYFPEFPYSSQITIDHLLHMDSGMVDYVNEWNVFYKDLNQFEAYNRGEMTDEKMLSLLNESHLSYDPGEKFSYCNTNYYLLALILEQVTGQTYEEYMKKNIFEICGMQNSTNTEVGNITSVPANGGEYMAAARGSRGAGDIHSNVCDILLWDRALMSQQIINSEQLQYMTEMRNGYSCGWMARESGNMDHGGSTPSYRSRNAVLQVEDIGNVYVIIMTTNPNKDYILQHITTMVEEYFNGETKSQGEELGQSESRYQELTFGFADAKEGATLIKGNTEYLNGLTQNELCFRLQKKDATLEEYTAFAAEQVLDFTEEEKAGVSACMQRIMDICQENHYKLPEIGEITFVKTTMKEESGATAYTHGTQIYMGESMLSLLSNKNQWAQKSGTTILVHELFHCLTRNDAQFRKDMYEILGFRIQEEEFAFPEEIRQQIISNPDVGRHDAYATFRIEGKDRDCVVIFTTARPFKNPGDNIFALATVGLVPIDNLSVIYPSGRAENFWEVFGRNTDYVVDPEEALADNFSFAIMYGMEGVNYASPEIIKAICDYLKK